MMVARRSALLLTPKVNFLPVITRELQVQSRQAVTNRMRWIAAGLVMLIWCFLMSVGHHATPHERAQVIFVAIGILALFHAMMAGIFQTSDCISEERREGTLGLLFLTDLKGYDVVFGKLASTSLNSFYTFLAIIPVMALPLLMGGTTVGEFGRVTLVLVVTMFLSLSIGMLISTLSRDARGAMSLTFLVMVALAAIMPVCWLLMITGNMTRGHSFILWPSPPHAFQSAFDNYYSSTSGMKQFWWSVMTLSGIGAACLVAASAILPRVWQQSGDGTGGKMSWLRRSVWRGARQNARHAAHRLRYTRPFLWLAMRDARPRRLAYWVFALVTPGWVYLYMRLFLQPGSSRGEGEFAMLMMGTFVMHLILKCLVAAESSRRFSEDRASGALELLLVTPLRPAEIVASQFRSVWTAFRWGYMVLTLMNAAMLMWVLNSHMFGGDGEARTMFSMMMAGGIIMLYVDSYALINVGMWTAMTKKRHVRAFMATVFRVLLPPWLAVLFFIFMGIAGAFNGSKNFFEGMMVVWFVLGGVVSFVAAGVAASSLDLHFRQIASTGRVESKEEQLASGL